MGPDVDGNPWKRPLPRTRASSVLQRACSKASGSRARAERPNGACCEPGVLRAGEVARGRSGDAKSAQRPSPRALAARSPKSACSGKHGGVPASVEHKSHSTGAARLLGATICREPGTPTVLPRARSKASGSRARTERTERSARSVREKRARPDRSYRSSNSLQNATSVGRSPVTGSGASSGHRR